MFTFVSPTHNYKIVLRPSYQQVINGIAELVYGKSVQFEKGELKVSDKETADAIRKSKGFGKYCFEQKQEKIKKGKA